MKAIIAINNLGYIGLGGKLPWKSSDDLNHFKNLTVNSTLLAGYNTAKELPNLPDRIVLVYNEVHDDEYYLDKCDWCIGGKKTYERFAKYFTELHVSIIDDETIGDTLFPNFNDINPYCKIFYYNFKKDLI